MLTVGQKVNVRRGQKTLACGEGRRGTIRCGIGDAHPLLRIYHWQQDADYEFDLLLSQGIRRDQIRRGEPKFITMIDTPTKTVAKHIEAIPSPDGSGSLFVLEIHGATATQVAAILRAEAYEEEIVESTIEYRLFGQREVRQRPLVLRRWDMMLTTTANLQQMIADDHDTQPSNVTFVGEWAERAQREVTAA